MNINKRLIELSLPAGGVFGISAKHLSTGEEIKINSDCRFIAASIIKIPIMVEAFKQAEKGVIDLQSKVELTDIKKVGGSGILKIISQGIKIPLIDIISLMIVVSDNTASNILIDLLGIDRINNTMQEYGLTGTFLRRKFMILPQAIPTPNSVTSHDITGLLEKIAKGQIISQRACEEMVRIMKNQTSNNLIPAFILSSDCKDKELIGQIKNIEIANKTGSISNVRHDAAIVYTRSGDYVVTILSSNLTDPYKGEDAIRKISFEIYRYYCCSG